MESETPCIYIYIHIHIGERMERGSPENRMYIWEQIQFEWISSKLEMGNPGLPDPRSYWFLSLFTSFFFLCFFRPLVYSILCLSLSLSLVSPYLVTVYYSFVTRIVMSLFCSLSLSHFFSSANLLLPTSIFLHNVDLNAMFKGKFRGNGGKHFIPSGFLLRMLLSLLERKCKPFFTVFFVNN